MQTAIYHPGTILRTAYLERFQIGVSEAAKALGVSRKTLSLLLNGRSAITPDMALRLARAFSTTPHFWLLLQMEHDVVEAAKGFEESRVSRLV